MKLLILLVLPVLIYSQPNNPSDIFDAVREGKLEEVVTYREENPKVIDTINSHNHSLLIIAAYYGKFDIMEYLLPYASNMNYNSANGTALAAAVVKNNIDIIELLLSYHADVNLADAHGVSPLMYAILFKNTKVITLLLKHGADKSAVDKAGKTTFEYALATSNQNIINLLKN